MKLTSKIGIGSSEFGQEDWNRCISNSSPNVCHCHPSEVSVISTPAISASIVSHSYSPTSGSLHSIQIEYRSTTRIRNFKHNLKCDLNIGLLKHLSPTLHPLSPSLIERERLSVWGEQSPATVPRWPTWQTTFHSGLNPMEGEWCDMGKGGW